MNTPRQLKVARLIQKDLADLLQKFAKDSLHGILLSVSIVRISPDLSLAKCYLSVFPSEKSEEVLELINSRIKEIRYQLGSRIRNQVRIIPQLVFYIDDSLDYLENIDHLLKE